MYYEIGTTETQVPLYIIAFSDLYPSGEVGYHAGHGDSQSKTNSYWHGVTRVTRGYQKDTETAEELEERRKKVQTRYNYSSPPLTRTPLLPNNCVLIREVYFGEREYYIPSQCLLPRICILSRGWSSHESVSLREGPL